jgi:hypothetical protein
LQSETDDAGHHDGKCQPVEGGERKRLGQE